MPGARRSNAHHRHTVTGEGRHGMRGGCGRTPPSAPHWPGVAKPTSTRRAVRAVRVERAVREAARAAVEDDDRAAGDPGLVCLEARALDPSKARVHHRDRAAGDLRREPRNAGGARRAGPIDDASRRACSFAVVVVVAGLVSRRTRARRARTAVGSAAVLVARASGARRERERERERDTRRPFVERERRTAA